MNTLQANVEEIVDLFEEQGEVTEETFAPIPEAPQSGIPLSDDDRLDLALVRDFISGRDDAFLALYAKYEAPLLHYCRKMCPDQRVAEDAFQEIWTMVFELRTKRTEVGRFQSLLFRTARNICLNAVRREWVRTRGKVELKNTLASVTLDSQSEQEEIRTLISQALAKLPIEQREVFVLHEYSGFSYGEIGVLLGKTENSVKTVAFRARIRLRKLIASWLGLTEDEEGSGKSPYPPKPH
ncbi:MAG: sigma-70 family RNA polymerase sigma factor [Bacteroidota bacterium]|nr:sigma-70 family RNA polymerase sigma factor [Bacteroidota bacterium]MDP4229062.1 sigma-70 family RNA polymerase sigma factor [Bacteroidota bacterium]MDP4235416.1 sigma-70 family RNA polymerase sigma factor [Bacteroidota bacterium]